MAPRYQRVGSPPLGSSSSSTSRSSPAARRSGLMGLLDTLARRPQRLIPLALLLFLLITFTSWLGFTDTGSETARNFASSAKAAGGRASEWWNSKNTKSSAGGDAGGAGGAQGTLGKGALIEHPSGHGQVSPADALYGFRPGEAPVTFSELQQWATKGSDGNLYPPSYIPSLSNKAPRAKAAFVVLVRNSEIEELQKSMKDVEFRFNRKYNYPWIFLNDVDFDDKFKKGVRQLTRAEIRFGKLPKEHWGYPDWIDQGKAAQTRKKMKDIIYGWSESYRHMCRFQSGFFFKHPLTLDLDYYWRVEPGIKLYCDIDYDPFLFMQLNNKSYGFTMALHEYEATIPTLWSSTKTFLQQHPHYLAADSARDFITDRKPGEPLELGNYNLCHWWSNFEIGSMAFLRGQAYQGYFAFLDKQGGFFYERWGDAPVHSIAAALFLNRSEIHHFNDIGYYHVPWDHCPANRKLFHDNGKCNCDPDKTFDREGYSCLPKWYEVAKEPVPW